LAEYDERTYWEDRYYQGETSGAGSYGSEAAFKIDLIISLVEELGCRTLLDLGCGDANIAFTLLKRLPHLRYLGLDISPYILNRNRRRAAKAKIPAIFCVGDLTKKWPTPISFDCVLLLDVLFHLKEDRSFFNALQNVLHFTGKVAVLTAWNPKALGTRQPEAAHCFYRDFSLERTGNWTQEEREVPNDPIKSLHILRRLG